MTQGSPSRNSGSAGQFGVRRPVIAEGLFSYQIGGSERVGADLAIEFSRRGYDVVCFAFYDSDGPIRAELERAGVRCLDLNYSRYHRITKRLTYQWAFWNMLRKERVDALHVHHATALILSGIPARLAHVSRVVMTEHGLYQLQERANYRRSAARYCRFADEITVVEPTQADYFEKQMGVPRSRLHYVANGVHMPEKTPVKVAHIRAQLQIPEGTFAFFYVGRLNPVKDLGTLLQAVSLLPDDISARVRLYVVGDGIERENLERQREALGLRDRVTFLGARNDVPQLLLAADGFAMSSVTEGLPMALLEAMACEVPCVATAVGGIPQLFSGERGLLAPPKNPVQLSEAMAQLVRDGSLRARLSSNAKVCVKENYSLDIVVDQYLKLLGLAPSFPAGRRS